MPIISRSVQSQKHKRVIELLRQGNSPKQVAARGILGERSVHRINKKLLAEESGVRSS